MVRPNIQTYGRHLDVVPDRSSAEGGSATRGTFPCLGVGDLPCVEAQRRPPLHAAHTSRPVQDAGLEVAGDVLLRNVQRQADPEERLCSSL